MTSTQTQTPAPVLPASLRVGAVELTVTDLDRSVGFYETAIGLRLHRREGGRAALGAGGEDLLVLVEDPNAPAAPAATPASTTSRCCIPRGSSSPAPPHRLAATRTRISGASDHGISEAIYLPDPDGNGIELAADRGREHWGDLSDPTALGGPEPLDLAGLLSLVADEEPQPHVSPGHVVGHVHLHVGDIDRGLAFYRDVDRLRGDDAARLGRVRRRRRLPPPPRLQHLARPRRPAGAGRHRRPAALDDRAPGGRRRGAARARDRRRRAVRGRARGPARARPVGHRRCWSCAAG